MQIPLTKQLEPYFKIAEKEAHKSPCTRRQYGTVIAHRIEGAFTVFYDSGHNERISTCCNGNVCARDVVNTRHGGSVEIGAEIHSEVAAIVRGGKALESSYLILVGFENGKELLDTNVYPCHSCAIVIKFAGYKHIYIRNAKNEIVSVSINSVISYRIAEWQTVD